MVDYAKLSATAERLIKKNGRQLTFVQHDKTPSNPSKPWLGAADPKGSGTTLDLDGVFVPPNTVREFGITALGRGTEIEDLLARSQQIVITATKNNDLRQFRQVFDDGVYWKILATQELKPGATSLIAFVGVRR